MKRRMAMTLAIHRGRVDRSAGQVSTLNAARKTQYVRSFHAFLDVTGVPGGAVGLRIGWSGPNRRGVVSAVERSHQIKSDPSCLILAGVELLLKRYIVLHGLLGWH